MLRSTVLEDIASRILGLEGTHPLRVGIDGIDAAGKTTLADELVPYLEAGGRKVIRASIDGFHNPRAVRYGRGADSAEGYYYDSFDIQALCAYLLAPLGPGSDRQYLTRVFDYRRDAAVISELQQADVSDILLFDGVFLFRPELLPYWDYRIFLDISFETSLSRALLRDRALFGSQKDITARYRKRYIPGQRLYLDAADPLSSADFVIDNNDPAHPKVSC